MNFYPENAAAMDAVVFDWVKGASSAPVVWGKQRLSDGSAAPMPPKPFVRLDMLVPPVMDGQSEQRSARAMQVVTAAPETLYTLSLGGTAYTYTSRTVGEGDDPVTATEVRDALIDLVNAGDEAASAGIAGPDALAFVTKPGADEPTLAVVTPDDEDPTLALKLARWAMSDGLATYSIDAFTDDRSAPAIVKAIELALDKDSILEALHAGGWSTSTILGGRKPDAVIASTWETRAGFDARLRCRMRSLEIVNFIDTATIGDGIVGAFTGGAGS